MLGLDRITFDPQIMGGRACIRGLPITVSRILQLAASGLTTEEIIDTLPDLEPDDIRQALQYAAGLAEDAPRPGASDRSRSLADLGLAPRSLDCV